MRPKSIVTFEYVVLGTLVLGIISSLVNREQAETQLADAGMPAGFLLGAQIAGIAINLLLLYFISRKASPVAKWIYAVLTALGIVFGLAGIAQVFAGGALTVVLTLVTFALSAYSLYLLFRPDANAWFNDGRGAAT